jgi:hypothetical protein
MSEAPEKAKNFPLRDYYNPNICFAIIFGAFAMMLFFRADELFGAVRLRPFYSIGSVASVIVAALIIVGLFGAWRIIPSTAATTGAALIALLVIVFNEMTLSLIIIGGFTSHIASQMPPVFLAAGAGVTLVIWLLDRFKLAVAAPALLKLFTTVALVATPLFLLGIGAAPKNSDFDFIDSEASAGHHYYLEVSYGQFNDMDYLELYECSEFALACESVYFEGLAPYVDLKDYDIHLVRNGEAGTISIVVDDKLLYMHPVN